MSFATGMHLGPYEVLAVFGAGGIGGAVSGGGHAVRVDLVERKSGGIQPTQAYASRLERRLESLVFGSFRFL